MPQIQDHDPDDFEPEEAEVDTDFEGDDDGFVPADGVDHDAIAAQFQARKAPTRTPKLSTATVVDGRRMTSARARFRGWPRPVRFLIFIVGVLFAFGLVQALVDTIGGGDTPAEVHRPAVTTVARPTESTVDPMRSMPKTHPMVAAFVESSDGGRRGLRNRLDILLSLDPDLCGLWFGFVGGAIQVRSPASESVDAPAEGRVPRRFPNADFPLIVFPSACPNAYAGTSAPTPAAPAATVPVPVDPAPAAPVAEVPAS